MGRGVGEVGRGHERWASTFSCVEHGIYEFALTVNTESDDSHYGIALCCFKDGDTSKAYKHIKEAINLVKDQPDF